MTYYLLKFYDPGTSYAVEYYWTNSVVIMDLFIEEYATSLDNNYTVDAYTDCDNKEVFFDAVADKDGIHIDEYSELLLDISEHDDSVYHITTTNIQEEICDSGQYDSSHRSLVNHIIKSSLNMKIISQYMKTDELSDALNMIISKYLAQFILLDNFTIHDAMSDGELNHEVLSYMEISPEDRDSLEWGIFSVVDRVMFTKICDADQIY